MYSAKASDVKCRECGARPKFEISRLLDGDSEPTSHKFQAYCPNGCISTEVYDKGGQVESAWIRINSPTGY